MLINEYPSTIEPLKRLTLNSLEKTDMIETSNLVIEAKDLLKLRSKICGLYADKKVIVAPCSSKLYISRQQKTIDADGKTWPDWFYFGTGVISIIYDTKNRDITIALFEKHSLRLLWCLKWAEFITFEIPTSSFHIINTKEDFSQHVGILYENKNVADLMLNAFKLLSESTINECGVCPKSSGKNRLMRSLSLHKKSKQNESSYKDSNTTVIKRKSSLRDSLRRKTIGWSQKKSENPLVEEVIVRKARSATINGDVSDHLISEVVYNNDLKSNHLIKQHNSGYESSPNISRTAHDNPLSNVKMSRLARALSFRYATQHNSSIDSSVQSSGRVMSSDDQSCKKEELEGKINIKVALERKVSTKEKLERQGSTKETFERQGSTKVALERQGSTKVALERTISTDSNGDNKDSNIRSLFKKRRISRTQSLKTVFRKQRFTSFSNITK